MCALNAPVCVALAWRIHEAFALASRGHRASLTTRFFASHSWPLLLFPWFLAISEVHRDDLPIALGIKFHDYLDSSAVIRRRQRGHPIEVFPVLIGYVMDYNIWLLKRDPHAHIFETLEIWAAPYNMVVPAFISQNNGAPRL